jgi:hypothetical protein
MDNNSQTTLLSMSTNTKGRTEDGEKPKQQEKVVVVTGSSTVMGNAYS